MRVAIHAPFAPYICDPPAAQWAYLLDRVAPLLVAAQATGAVLFVDPHAGLSTLAIEVAGRRYYLVKARNLACTRTAEAPIEALCRRLLAGPAAFDYTPHDAPPPPPGVPYDCPRCGSTLNRDDAGGHVWCSFVGGGIAMVPPCAFGIDAPVELADLLACPERDDAGLLAAPGATTMLVPEAAAIIEEVASLSFAVARPPVVPIEDLMDDRPGSRS